MEAGIAEEPLMKRMFALLTGAAIAIAWFAIVPDASAHARYFGGYGHYYGGAYGYYNGGSFRGSPMYAPNRAPPTNYYNHGRRDFQLAH
jgi:hypothetical protein